MSDLRNLLKDGDIVTMRGQDWNWDLWGNIQVSVARKGISAAQYKVFGQRRLPKDLRCWDSHCGMWFGGKGLFNVTLPSAKFDDLKEYENPKTNIILSVYRFNPKFWNWGLTPNDIDKMLDLAQKMVALKKPYDKGQLFDIMGNVMNMEPWKASTTWFDADGIKPKDTINEHLVCSVGLGAIIRDWRDGLIKRGIEIPEPWAIMNPNLWNPFTYDAYCKVNHWDVGTIFPANFALTDTHFKGEFTYLGDFRGGKKI
jgi:hypothetical protein